MTLQELSTQYQTEALAIQQRLPLLRRQLRQADDPALQRSLQQRICALQPMLRQCRELADLTGHYYDRGYKRHDAYTL